ncbi:SDR family oxidoreductase [Microbacterium sp. X-17]|uniref:SDR family NAD(P)-dependent oxidoreductase n=1 Tax=Microbacterium sp. X-17 TaxID=3144404 RepID=UPI0031F57D6E
MDLELTDKRALVTGGSRGIGKQVARALAAEGCDVVISARGEEALTATAEEIAAETGRKVTGIVADATSRESIEALVAGAVETLGGLDILVNCAAPAAGQSGPPPKLKAITDDFFWNEINTKVLGYLRTAQAAAPHMAANGWGRIVNIAGLSARTSMGPVGSIRNVSIAALTKTLADELARSGINVTAVHPGLTRTEATPGMISRIAQFQSISEEDAEKSLVGNSIRRLVDAAEVANVVVFLASPRSVAITGDAVAVGGGVPGPIHY